MQSSETTSLFGDDDYCYSVTPRRVVDVPTSQPKSSLLPRLATVCDMAIKNKEDGKTSTLPTTLWRTVSCDLSANRRWTHDSSQSVITSSTYFKTLFCLVNLKQSFRKLLKWP